MTAVLWWGSGPLEQWFGWGMSERVVHMLGLIGAGIVSYFVALLVVGVRPGMLLGRH